MSCQSCTMPFGKYRGCRLDEVPDSYVGWLRRLGDDLRQPLRGAVDAEYQRRNHWDGWGGSRYRWRRYGGSGDDGSNDDGDSTPRAAGKLPQRAKDIMRSGFKVLAKVSHPDITGGSNDVMGGLFEARQ